MVENLSKWNVTKSKQECRPLYSNAWLGKILNLVASEGRRSDVSVVKVAGTYLVFKQHIHDMCLSCRRHKKYDVAVYEIGKNTTEPRRTKKHL